MRILRFLLFSILLPLLLCADSFTLCYNNCNTCSATDFISCTNTTSPCVYGYALFDTTCNAVASFNNYATQFPSPSNISTPSDWTSNGASVTSTLTCNTIQSPQTITLIGPFTNQIVTKTYIVAPRFNMFVQLYFLRMGWGTSDSVSISISSGGNTIYNEIVTSSSYTSGLNNINYLNDCGSVPAAQLWGAQITLVSNASSNASSLTITFTPSITGSAQWAFSNIKVSTGCGSFMVSHNGTCNSCLSGYYYNRITLDCQKCNPLCNSCFGPTNTNCLSCPLESVLNGNTCVYSSNFYVMNDVFVDNGTVGNTSSCSNVNMLGGPTYGQITNALSRRYILPRHMLLKLSFWLTQTGDWSNVTRFTASVDGTPFITITNFQSPGISPLCLKQVGPVLVTTSEHYSNFMSHTNNEAVLTFSVEGAGNANTLYGINDISLVAFNCPPQCSECTLTANFTPNCLRCNQFLSQTSGCLLCPNGFYLDSSNQYSTICRKCYSTCLQCNGLTQQNCTACFPGYMLIGSYCTPNTSLSYTLYSQELTSNVFNFQDYTTTAGGDLNCGSYRIFGNSNSSPTTISRTWRSLPAHKGLILNMQVFKLGPWTNGTSIILKLDNNQVISIPINESAGSFLCSGNSDFVYTLSVPLAEHISNNLVMEASGTGGLAVGNVILSLQNCPDCSSSQFGYDVQYIPKYTLDNSQYGLNTWLKFNKNVRDVNVTELAQNFQLYMNAIPLNVTEWDNVNDLRLYTPFPNNYSFINGTLTILNKNPSQVISYANTNIPPQELTTIRSQTKIARYDTLVDDDYLIPINQLYTFFKGYSDAILYIAISLIGLGLGLVSQQFIAVLQIIFMHVYVMTHWLPATHKLPLSGMWRIEHLNYFMTRDINRIEGAILPKGLHQVSPHTFQQYHTDINFVRASYPIVVLNLIYLAYWIIMYVIYRCCPGFRRSPNVVVRWFREIVERPLNFFDYFFRLEFITVAWSCFCQYNHFYASPVKSFRDFNYFWTILFFICLCVYPFIIVCYLLRMRGITLKQTFNYQYEDIFFMRIKRNHDEMSSFIYILVRFLRYFIICCFMAFFASGSIVGPILCMIMTVVQTLFILFRTIYIDPFYLLFKIVENIFLFLLDIIYIVIFATANQWSLPSYLNLGYVANAFIIVLLINASLRALYILYLKLRTFCARNYRLDRAYNTSSFGYDYKPAPMTEMARYSGIGGMGGMGGMGMGGGGIQMVSPNMMMGPIGGFGGVQGPVPIVPLGGNMNMNMMGGNVIENNMMMMDNPIRTSTTTIMNQGGNFGVNPVVMNTGMNMVMGMNTGGMAMNQITTVPTNPIRTSIVNNIGGNFGYTQAGFGQQGFVAETLPTTSVHRIRQQTHFNPGFIETNVNNNFNNNGNIPQMLAQGANDAIGRGSIHGGNLMLASNVGGYIPNYNTNLVEPYHEEVAYERHTLRNSQVNRF